jgi:hypothetical protein
MSMPIKTLKIEKRKLEKEGWLQSPLVDLFGHPQQSWGSSATFVWLEMVLTTLNRPSGRWFEHLKGNFQIF